MRIVSKRTISLVVLLVLGIATVLVKVTLLPLTVSTDYVQYIETAKLFSREDVAAVYPIRIIKPLNPLVVAFIRLFAGSFSAAFLWQVILFYLALIIVFFAFAWEFFKAEISASLATALFIFGYPMLKYGLDLYIEAGALFYYILSLYWTLLFLKKPSQTVFIANLATIILGFFWKEYSIVNYIIFNVILIMHSGMERRTRAQFLLLLNGVFLGVNGLWQLVVYVKYQYTYFQLYEMGLGRFPVEYNAYNISKSLFGVLMLGWLLVVVGLRHRERLNEMQRKFLAVLAIWPLIVFLWGSVASRYFQVLAPPYILLAAFGLQNLTDRKDLQIGITSIVVLVNVVWLYLSYSIKL